MDASRRGDDRWQEGVTQALGRVALPIFINLRPSPPGEREIKVLMARGAIQRGVVSAASSYPAGAESWGHSSSRRGIQPGGRGTRGMRTTAKTKLCRTMDIGIRETRRANIPHMRAVSLQRQRVRDSPESQPPARTRAAHEPERLHHYIESKRPALLVTPPAKPRTRRREENGSGFRDGWHGPIQSN